jgi:TonB-linked SusC/RagA family outer membrane protein
MKRITSMLVCLFLFGFTAIFAQDIQLKGKITSADDGSALPGVSIVVKGTTTGVASDVNGNFTLTVPSDATIMVSSVGYTTQELQVAGKTVINVALTSEVLAVDEVVVTALGIARTKKSLGYAVQEIASDDISRASNPNLETSIQGKLTGVEVRQASGMPGSPSTIFIRGARSFSDNNQPLYVVDGMPIASNPDYTQGGGGVTGSYYSARAIDIDPNNIESINVLKGQAAAALYGLRASNGVIVITTKSGKTNTLGRPKFELTTSYTADVISIWPDVQQTYAQGYVNYGTTDYSDISFYPAMSYSWGPKISDLPNDLTYGGNSQGHPGQWFDPYKGQWVTPQAYNNPKGFFENGNTWYKGINVSNSTNFGDYLIGFSATNQNGIVPNTGMDRYNANASANVKLGKMWKAGFTGNYSDLSLKKLPSGNNSYLFTVVGAPASFDLMGTPYHMEGVNGEYRQISYRRGAVGENPRWAIANNQFNEATRRFFGNSYLQFTPVTWMNVRYQLGIDTYATDNEDIYEMGSTATGQALPTASQYPSPGNEVYGYRQPTGGSINNYGINATTVNSLLNITFQKRITDKLNAILLIGNEFNDYQAREWTMTGTGFTIPGWDNMSNTTTQTSDETKYHERTVGTYYNLALEFSDMIYFNTTGRYDIVSTMPNGNRSFFYPSVSLGWVFTELGGLKDNDILSFGKVRGSFAQVGQAGTYHEKTYAQGNAASGYLDDGILFPLGGVSGFEPNTTVYDPNLKPQNTTNWELGLELRFLKNRIGIDYTYSSQDATDQIFSVPMAGSTGYYSYVTNAGEMTSKAHELALILTPVKAGSFDWTINVNFTKVVNEVVELAPGIESVSLAGFETPNVRAYAGNTYPTIYGAMMLRDDQGRIVIDDDPNSYYYGFPQSGGSGKIGDVSPDFIMGMTNTFTYKWVSLSALLDWKQGGDIYSGTNRLMCLYGSAAYTEDRETPFTYEDTYNSKGQGVKSDGSPNDIVRGGPNDVWAYPDFNNDVKGTIDEMNIYETSYIKLREVALNFNLPKKLLESIKMQGASIGIVGRNFLLWSTIPNVDPEVSQGMGNGQMGFEYVSLPQTSSYGVNLTLTF